MNGGIHCGFTFDEAEIIKKVLSPEYAYNALFSRKVNTLKKELVFDGINISFLNKNVNENWSRFDRVFIVFSTD